LILTSRAIVPEEITILQFWRLIIASRYPVPAECVVWGKHCREGVVVETGKVTRLAQADSVEVIIEEN
jgi:hypothetical protein